MLSFALGVLLVGVQDPSPSPTPEDRPANEPARREADAGDDAPTSRATPKPVPRLEEWDDREAREKVRAFEDSVEDRDASMADKMAALDAVARGRHEKLVGALSDLLKRDDSLVVCTRAAELLGQQPAGKAKRAIAFWLRAPKFEQVPGVQAALVRSLARTDYEARDWRLIDGMFEQAYEPERAGLQKAILELVTEHRELQAIDLLVDNLGEPIPENPNSPSNPPASYWEARWKAWQVWRDEVKGALLAITGQRFSTKKEARTWLRNNRRELERRARRGAR